MKNLLYIVLLCMGLLCCSKDSRADIEQLKKEMDYTKLPSYTKEGNRINNTNDTLEYYNQSLRDIEYINPGDTIYDPVAEGYPDTIKVAFTRNGVFEDSIEVVRVGGGPPDFTEYRYVYMLQCVVGDVWFYSRDGKFLSFGCAKEPHAGYPHHYVP